MVGWKSELQILIKLNLIQKIKLFKNLLREFRCYVGSSFSFSQFPLNNLTNPSIIYSSKRKKDGWRRKYLPLFHSPTPSDDDDDDDNVDEGMNEFHFSPSYFFCSNDNDDDDEFRVENCK